MKPLLFIDVLLLIVLAVGWAISESVGYSGRAIVHQRAWVLDVVLGEIAVWTGRVADPRATPVIAPATQPTTATVDPLLGLDLVNDSPTDQLVYERPGAMTTDQWFTAAKQKEKQTSGLFICGFGYGRSSSIYYAPPLAAGAVGRVFVVPFWFLVAMLLIAPVRSIIRKSRDDRSQRWLAQGRCPACGYDMRATPDRCPECGAGKNA
jgi:hypothetical protein